MLDREAGNLAQILTAAVLAVLLALATVATAVVVSAGRTDSAGRAERPAGMTTAGSSWTVAGTDGSSWT